MNKLELVAVFMGYKLDRDGNYLMPLTLPQFRDSDHGEWCHQQSLDGDWDTPGYLELYKETGGGYWCISPDHIRYDRSWDWLMPVVEKIESLKGRIDIHQYGCSLQYKFGSVAQEFAEETKIASVFKAVVDFIEWYNKYK